MNVHKPTMRISGLMGDASRESGSFAILPPAFDGQDSPKTVKYRRVHPRDAFDAVKTPGISRL
ncbi:MAG: hypothetical protein J2P13_01250 [Acidobacteria bacterium]|nr:hypothetical protein [Acidobacteriota bacterium]